MNVCITCAARKAPAAATIAFALTPVWRSDLMVSDLLPILATAVSMAAEFLPHEQATHSGDYHVDKKAWVAHCPLSRAKTPTMKRVF
jgi:hypothetical protein